MSSFSPISINIASQPFRRERAQNAALAGICALLTCSLLVLTALILHSRAQAADIRNVIESESARLKRLQAEQGRYSAILAQPQNADVFAWSTFLNELIARRGVSWTRVFEDLGTVMPSNMRLVGIRLPQVAAQDGGGINRVQLDMVVATDQASTVIDLLKRLQQSSLFGPATVMTQTPPTQNDPMYKFRVLVAYAQKL
jgi:heme exporter protein D